MPSGTGGALCVLKYGILLSEEELKEAPPLVLDVLLLLMLLPVAIMCTSASASASAALVAVFGTKHTWMALCSVDKTPVILPEWKSYLFGLYWAEPNAKARTMSSSPHYVYGVQILSCSAMCLHRTMLDSFKLVSKSI